MRELQKLDIGSKLTILATFGLFLVALFVKGIGKDLILEAGVLMVSVKLITMSVKSARESKALREDLDRILELLEAGLKSEPERGDTE